MAKHIVAKLILSISFNQLSSNTDKTLSLKCRSHLILRKFKQERDKHVREGNRKRNRGQPKLAISMEKGQSQTRSNSSVSNTFSPNQTRTPLLAGEKARSQQQLRDSTRLKYQSSWDSCRYSGVFGQVCHILQKGGLPRATDSLFIILKWWNPFTLVTNLSKPELRNFSLKYSPYILSQWFGKNSINSELKVLLLRSVELRFYL